MRKAIFDVAEFKALEDEAGTFEAIVSVFGNVDLVGDRVMPGAFAASLDSWKSSGTPIPIIWSHEWGNPEAHIGEVLEASETDAGLWVKGQLDIDERFAGKVYDLLRKRRVKEFSFAYDIVKEKRAEDGANELKELRLIEVGPTLKGANPSTELLAVKSALEDAARPEEPQVKSGRAISAKNEELIRQAHDALGKVLGSLTQDDDDKGEDEAEADGKASIPPEDIAIRQRINELRG